MDNETASALNALNRRFYDACASSFSETRSTAWEGWRTCFDAMRPLLPMLEAPACEAAEHASLRVLDLACGNMRFERFLADELGGYPCIVHAVDSSDALAHAASPPSSVSVEYESRDIIGGLLACDALVQAGFDLAVCFGFMHHVPGADLRERLLQALCGSVRSGGAVAVSFWRFLDDERLARKAHAATARARIELARAFDWTRLDAGDRLLGWQDRTDVFRYAHSFSDAEIDALIASLGDRAELIARFHSDGRSDALNEYIVLRAR